MDCVARGLLDVGTDSPEEQEVDSSAMETPITKVAKRVIFIFLASLLYLLTESYPFSDIQLMWSLFQMRYGVKILPLDLFE